jgi:limonene-1,2-epoxide hydrolase
MRRRLLAAATLALVVAGCGASTTSPRAVVNAWARALSADDNDAAASLFARDAAVVQGDQLTYLHTHADAVRWNARLPCAGTVVSLREDGSAATATFRLGDRRHRRCADPPGAEAIALFVVEHGKIILWDQIGSQISVGH